MVDAIFSFLASKNHLEIWCVINQSYLMDNCLFFFLSDRIMVLLSISISALIFETVVLLIEARQLFKQNVKKCKK